VVLHEKGKVPKKEEREDAAFRGEKVCVSCLHCKRRSPPLGGGGDYMEFKFREERATSGRGNQLRKKEILDSSNTPKGVSRKRKERRGELRGKNAEGEDDSEGVCPDASKNPFPGGRKASQQSDARGRRRGKRVLGGPRAART